MKTTRKVFRTWSELNPAERGQIQATVNRPPGGWENYRWFNAMNGGDWERESSAFFAWSGPFANQVADVLVENLPDNVKTTIDELLEAGTDDVAIRAVVYQATAHSSEKKSETIRLAVDAYLDAKRTKVGALAGHATRVQAEAADIVREADEQLDQVRAATRFATAANAAGLYEQSVHARGELNTVRAGLSDLDLVARCNRVQNLLIDLENVLDELKSTDGRGPAEASQILAGDVQAAAIAFHALADRIRNKQTGGDDALAELLEIDRAIGLEASNGK